MNGFIKENLDKSGKVISYRIAVSLGKDLTTNNKYKYHFETVKSDSKRIAAKRLREIQNEIDKGVFVEPSKLTLKYYLEQWLNDYCKPNLSPKSVESYEYLINTHIIPKIGQIPLTALKSQQIQHFESQKLLSGRSDGNGGLSNRTVQYIHSTLHKSLKMAVKQHLLILNPMDGVEFPKVKRHEFKTMNEDDINKFLEAIKTSEYYPLFFTDLFSGMRRSELLALRWGDIDLLGMTASVNRTLQYSKGEIIFRSPKTAKSRRLIALTPANCTVLRDHKAKQEQLRQSLGLPPLSGNDLVFSHFDGKPYLPNSITHTWIKLIRHNGFSGIRLHDARHSHASILLKQGVHPKIVQERLGHATIATTLDLYSHVAPGLQAAAAAKFDDILKTKESKLDKELKDIIQN